MKFTSRFREINRNKNNENLCANVEFRPCARNAPESKIAILAYTVSKFTSKIDANRSPIEGCVGAKFRSGNRRYFLKMANVSFTHKIEEISNRP